MLVTALQVFTGGYRQEENFQPFLCLSFNINRRDMEKWKSMFAVSADMCMTLRREIRKVTSLLALRLKNFPMSGYVPYVAQAKKSFLLNNKNVIREGAFYNLGRVDFRL
jgi:hypothetical protein